MCAALWCSYAPGCQNLIIICVLRVFLKLTCDRFARVNLTFNDGTLRNLTT